MWNIGLLPDNFQGDFDLLCDNWRGIIPDTLGDLPINYLELGVGLGGNVYSVCQTYGGHHESKIVCISCDQNTKACERHMQESHKYDHLNIIQGQPHNILPLLDENTFDIVYISGETNKEWVMEYAVLCFRKVKKGGYIVFGSYTSLTNNKASRCIDGFIHAYNDKLDVIGIRGTQVFIQKKV